MILQLLPTPPADARMKAADFSIASTEEITSRCALALCWARVENSCDAAAICLARVSSSERTRSSIKGPTRISASKASRARIPNSALSLTRLRLKLTLAIPVPLAPAVKVPTGVQEAFGGLAKIRTILRFYNRWMTMPDEIAEPLTSASPNALAQVEAEIARACKEA